MAEENSPYALVVIGSSAGGIEALSTLVRSLPVAFLAPIVIAQHPDPTRTSHLAEILGRHTALQVRTVAERAPLEPGVILVVPTNRLVEISDRQVVVRPDGAHRPQPSVDLLFRSAARAFGERLIAVVLTGTGSVGAVGAREVTQAGGTVIIQNPDTAAFPGMPERLTPTTVDIVANLENIGSLLADLVSGAAMPALSEKDLTLAALLEELREQSGIDFGSYKTPTIMRRLQRRLVATGAENLPAYIRFLQIHPEEYQRLISSFLIKVTGFFRDPELFVYLREHVLPQLVADSRRRGNELRLWSAGCATGEEAYSLAIALAEVLGDDLERFGVRLFATDLDGEAVAFARRGIYPASALANLPADLVARYFAALDGEYEIKKRVRSLTVFGQHDLGRRAPFPRIDLVLCRNVLIYFTTELQKRALQLFAFSLRDGGYLILGKSESTSPLAELFGQEQPHLRVYQRHGDRLLIPPARITDIPQVTSGRLVSRRRPAEELDAGLTSRDASRPESSNERIELRSTNEEAQAASEEVETLNDELQATVEELNTTNDDLQARSVELQDLAVSLEAQRRESDVTRERLEAILQEIGDAVLVVDSEANPVLINRAFAQLFGGEAATFRAEDRSGHPLPPEATPQRRAANLESFSMEFKAVTADGGRRWFEANGRPVRGARAARLGVVVMRDITERGLRRLQEQRLAMATHELRNPLTALQGSLQLLARRLGPLEDTRNHDLLEMALAQAHQLDRLTSDLADVVRLQIGRLQLGRQPVDLEALARRVVESTRVGNGGTALALEMDGSAPLVEGDAARLEQVVANLLQNALVHAPESERIEVRVRREGDRAVLEVQDYGPGIAATDLPALFEPFWRVEDGDRPQHGLGLGLYIAKELVEAHGGSIEVRSTPGEGATFTVRLRVASAGEARDGEA
jgi:PAS domain S-box-containing protein